MDYGCALGVLALEPSDFCKVGVDYGFTLGVLALKPSGFCNVGDNTASDEGECV
jgi:hypothetical protein